MTKRERTPEDEAAFRAWIERAKAVPIEDVLRRLGGLPRRDDQGGPCPRPGCFDARKPINRSDRFSINRRKNLFFCRATDSGGPTFELVRHVRDMPFMEAVEFVSGEKPPILSRAETDQERRERERKLEEEFAAAERRRAEQDKISQEMRDRERRKAFEIWTRGRHFFGTPVEAYLAKRGLAAPEEAHLRFLDNHDFWDGAAGEGGGVAFSGPCMAAAMQRYDARRGIEVFSCLHRTWIDLDAPKGKRRILDSKTGEMISAKKMRGSKKGASIVLARQPDGEGAIVRWFLAEGIENALAIWRAMRDARSPLLVGAEFRAAGDLGNLSGRAASRIAHPTDTITDAKGRKRRKMIPGPDPIDPDDDPVIAIPPGVVDLYLIEDGSSEPFFTQNAIMRAAARFARENPQLRIRRVEAASGLDHNDMLLRGGE